MAVFLNVFYISGFALAGLEGAAACPPPDKSGSMGSEVIVPLLPVVLEALDALAGVKAASGLWRFSRYS